MTYSLSSHTIGWSSNPSRSSVPLIHLQRPLHVMYLQYILRRPGRGLPTSTRTQPVWIFNFLLLASNTHKAHSRITNIVAIACFRLGFPSLLGSPGRQHIWIASIVLRKRRTQSVTHFGSGWPRILDGAKGGSNASMNEKVKPGFLFCRFITSSVAY